MIRFSKQFTDFLAQGLKLLILYLKDLEEVLGLKVEVFLSSKCSILQKFVLNLANLLNKRAPFASKQFLTERLDTGLFTKIRH